MENEKVLSFSNIRQENESTVHFENLDVTINGEEKNFIEINSITRSYFILMTNLVESPRLRSFFSREEFDSENKKWNVYTTDYTRHFLTEGLAIYSIKKEGVHSYLVVPNEAGEQQDKASAELKQLLSDPAAEVILEDKLNGCGFKVPKTTSTKYKTNFELDPTRLWPLVILKSEQNAEENLIEIENFECGVKWNVNGGETHTAYSDSIMELGQTKVNLDIKGDVKEVTFKLPYICAAFDALTSISFDGEEEVILFTT
ncbi:hypothetical protein L1285_19685 [Pseudoalteromonas sp. DL2-H2.2]|uniref:hypothetical protein n=1 Tax=Pseudoalteromonas sp. DL2-H2.2 TaxID=2908889 RepID=UPI001F2F72C9|nr:hypothetical protein [Pseudoalteromonas sp. DL2-H2.2]MCF2910537.1 hypothetical protein [Pseudoalteromonas sp. DL2-H2.2]